MAVLLSSVKQNLVDRRICVKFKLYVVNNDLEKINEIRVMETLQGFSYWVRKIEYKYIKEIRTARIKPI